MAGYPGKQGRKPKPTTIAADMRDRPEIVPPKLPSAPPHLSKEEKKVWRKVGKQLLDAGLLGTLDAGALAAYSVAYCRWVEANKKIQEHGMLVKSPNGFPMQSPYLPIANKAMEQMVKLMSEMGMTPASRVRLPKMEKPKTQRRAPAQASTSDPRGILEVVK